jgi:hypothetical protein
MTDLYGAAVAEIIPIQYGGSMKPDNAKGLLAQKDIDGGLIGGAALKADLTLTPRSFTGSGRFRSIPRPVGPRRVRGAMFERRERAAGPLSTQIPS